jgi:RimJ/RimL family protein N-acetyltransferase
MPIINGERIRLRAAEKEDIPLFLRWVNDEEVAENLLLITPISRYEEDNWYESMMAKSPYEHVLVIEVKDSQNQERITPIGNCQFLDIDWRSRSSEIGIMIGEKSYWNHGYGTETMRLMLKYGFTTLNLHRIWLRVFAQNKRGIRAYEKAGFQYEGKYRQAEYQHGEYQDVLLMSILIDEWREPQTADNRQ